MTNDLSLLTSPMDVTTWVYEEATGLLEQKLYDDGNGPVYTYTPDGRLDTRTWARGTITTYGYDSDTLELLTVTYSDSTPTVTNQYDRLGRLTKVTDAFGTKDFTYNDDLQSLAEIWNGLQINTLTRKYDTQGRPAGITLNGTTYETTYGYTSEGRFDTLTHAPSSYTADYAYTTDSELLAGYTLGDFERQVSYEPTRNLVSEISNQFSDLPNPPLTISEFTYTNDDAGRRTNRDDSGTAFASTQTNSFAYNTRNEVTSTTMRNGNSTYSFDQIGNRVDVSVPDALPQIDYTTNALNQYTLIDGPTASTPSYDADGNLTDDDKGKTFTWNGENRMITATIGNTLLENTYDSQGRRVRKLVKEFGVTQKDIRYLYDGWNLLYEIDILGTNPTRYYVWGLDLSQSMQGAGGVGGLLFTSTINDAHAVSYDANGNISEYIDLADGSITAHLEYDAFGRTIASTGTAPASFGFSTKYQDEETGYYYYGFRYYDPETGRWPNRDPIGERGGYNLYLLAGNDGVNLVDILGLSSGDCCGDKKRPKGKRGSQVICCGGKWLSQNVTCCKNGQTVDKIPLWENEYSSLSSCIDHLSQTNGESGKYDNSWANTADQLITGALVTIATKGLGMGPKSAWGAGASTALVRGGLELPGVYSKITRAAAKDKCNKKVCPN